MYLDNLWQYMYVMEQEFQMNKKYWLIFRYLSVYFQDINVYVLMRKIIQISKCEIQVDIKNNYFMVVENKLNCFINMEYFVLLYVLVFVCNVYLLV